MAANPTTSGGTSTSTQELEWLLRQFAADVSDVTHAVLLSREGLRLLDSDVPRDWADKLSAAVSGIASLATNITGPTGKKMPPKLNFFERDDCLFLIQSAGRTAAFPNMPGTKHGMVDTVLAVIAAPNANVGTVSYEMTRLIGRFAPHMEAPVRVAAGDDAP
ncbi:roadblock/LC7 domain-containing protein [Streptomyces sp. NPDC002520]